MVSALQTCIVPLILVVSVCFYSLGYTLQFNILQSLAQSDLRVQQAVIAPSVITPPPVPEPLRITIAFTGDFLMHVPIGNSVYDSEEGTYDFGSVFEPVRPWLESADYTVANLETRLAGRERGYHGFPRFNTSADLATHIKNAGIDLLATANNHCLDWGYDGIVATLDNIDNAGLGRMGTYKSPDEKLIPFMAEINGIKVAFLNYTERTNGLVISREHSYAYNLLEADAVIYEAELARENGADIVVAVLHYGNEYQRNPSTFQRTVSREICEGGVDAVIGAHPHVVQPVEWIDVERDGSTRQCLVAYSLGNFVSCQRERYRDAGIILYLEIEKFEGETVITGVSYLPVWVQKAYSGGRSRWRVLPVHPDIEPVTEFELSEWDRSRLEQVWEDTEEKVGIVPVQVSIE